MLCCSSKSSKKQNTTFDPYFLSQKYRFSPKELFEYQNRYNRISKGKEMTLKKFRKSLGILGLEETSLLADRIFKLMDRQNKNSVNFEEYLSYMDIVIHGTKDEKLLQSFNLISQGQKLILFKDFKDWIKSVKKMSAKLTGSFVACEDENIQQLFISVDYKNDGAIDFEEFRKSAYTQPKVFAKLTLYKFDVGERENNQADEVEQYRQRLESIENNLNFCIQALKETEAKATPIIEISYASDQSMPERGPVCFSQLDFEPVGDVDSPTLTEDESFNPRSVKSSVVLDRLQELSVKLEQLKQSDSRSRRTTVFNVPKKIDTKKKNKISWGDEDWSLILYMMLGIQKSVKANLNESFHVISNEDFSTVEKYDLKQNDSGKSHDKTSKFRDFAPLVFSNIRRMFEISDLSYLESLGVENIMESMMKCEFSSLIGLISSGKSGSFFYFSDDGKYVLKTMSGDEYSYFQKILPDYYSYLNENPESLIPKFFGFHNIKFASKTKNLKKNFIVMENLFCSGLEIHMRFDLKGSSVGRTTDPAEDFSVARKDMDFNRSGLKIKLSTSMRDKVLNQIGKDCKFFQNLGIIDYSLLVGIHNLRGTRVHMAGLSHAYLSSDHECIYFIGIIDVLTQYNMKKKLENVFKLPIYGNDISCIPPKPYAERFMSYMLNIFE